MWRRRLPLGVDGPLCQPPGGRRPRAAAGKRLRRQRHRRRQHVKRPDSTSFHMLGPMFRGARRWWRTGVATREVVIWRSSAIGRPRSDERDWKATIRRLRPAGNPPGRSAIGCTAIAMVIVREGSAGLQGRTVRRGVAPGRLVATSGPCRTTPCRTGSTACARMPLVCQREGVADCLNFW